MTKPTLVTNIVARIVVVVICVMGMVSCASISVEDGTERVTLKKPEMIYVMDFGTKQGDFEVDRKGSELAEFKKNLQLMLKAAMAADLTDKLMPAVPGKKSDWSQHANAWLVTGEFTKVEQGSRLLRSTIGFGAGGTKLETRVQVYNLARNSGTPFLTFSTTGGSGAEPGAIMALSGDPVQLAIGAVGGAAHGLSEDTSRTAREITAQFSDYMYNRGWIPENQRIKPKHERQTDTW